jgi:hypothetical protein
MYLKKCVHLKKKVLLFVLTTKQLIVIIEHLIVIVIIEHINTKLAIHALDQVHCWGAYFHPRIGHYEKFTHLNFQPLLFSKQRRLVDRRFTLEPLVAKTIMYTVPYSSEVV